MKLFYNILKVFAALIILVAVTLFTASFLLQDKVAGMILKSINNEILTKFEFQSARLSFLRKFPKASLYLQNVYVHSSPGFDALSFEKINTDTLLSAKSVIAEFNITDIIKGIYYIDRISVKEGRLNIFTDTAGRVNYEISTNTGQVSGNIFKMNLERITVSDVTAIYNNLATKLIIRGLVDNGLIKSSISGNDIDFTADGDMRINIFRLYNFCIAKSIKAGLNVALHSSDKGILFSKSTMIFDNYDFTLSGFVSEDDVLDLALTGNNINISGIKSYLPEKYREKISSYNPSGILNIQSKIKGPLTRKLNPHIEINFDLEKGHVSYLNSALNINDLSFNGLFTNGTKNSLLTSSLSFTNFRGMLGTAHYSGSLLLSDFDSLNGILALNGKLIPSEIKEFFNLNKISAASGNIDFNLKMNGNVPLRKKYTLADFMNLNPVADLNFNSFGIGLRKDKIRVDHVTGNLVVSDTVTAKNLKFTFNDQEFGVTGTFINLADWISGSPVNLIASARLSCKSLKPELLFKGLSRQDTIAANRRAYSLPEDIFLDLNFIIDKFEYKSYSAEKIVGVMGFKPRILNFKSLKLNTFDGVVSGNGFFVQNTNKLFIGRGSFLFEKIDVKKTFTTFHNFGQDFIKAENLSGKLSGSLSVLIPTDSLLKPIIKSITAEGKYVVENGALIDFGPIQKLSSFIAISELKDIHFEQMENDFFIRNNFFYIPQMGVKSSAANLTISGKHSFDNNYEYHVKILLSEMLSAKIKKPKPNTTEFGAVQDDGLGRTSMLLKVENKGEDIKVSYDVKAAGNLIKNDIKSERKTLKTILNQEYGLFKKDTTVTKKPAGNTPRFKIIWGDADTSKKEVAAPPEKQENKIKKLFGKK